MAVLGRKPVIERFDEMTEPGQYFPVGEVFLYRPLSEPDTKMLLQTLAVPKDAKEWCSTCALEKYCCDHRNSIDGVYFVPECADTERLDHKYVLFKRM